MHNCKDVYSIRQNFVNQVVRETTDSTCPCRLIIKTITLWMALNLYQSAMNRMEELAPQFLTQAFVMFGCCHKFNIGLAVIDQLLHEIACNASCMTSSAGRSLAMPSRI